jgi:hypothetical protein
MGSKWLNLRLSLKEQQKEKRGEGGKEEREEGEGVVEANEKNVSISTG